MAQTIGRHALVAGFPQSWYAWRRVIPLLAEQFNVIAVDLPGQGDSDIPADGYDTETTSDRISALVAALGHDRHVYVGHDIGAWIGYPYAHRHADQLRGLVLLDGNIPGVTLPPKIGLGHRSWHFPFHLVDDLPEALLRDRERIYIEWFFRTKTANWLNTWSHADLDEYERVYRNPGGLRGMLGYYRAALIDMEQNASHAKNGIPVPVLALGGDVGDAPDLFERAQELGSDVRGGQIKNSGHYIPEEQPAALVDEIIAFVDTLKP